ncbi:MAG: DUF885 domain-containing protein [Steroidobacteraceae bacterium]|nr:DUF885 domain-containing protein [Steroidobacteraceae bacterium]
MTTTNPTHPALLRSIWICLVALLTACAPEPPSEPTMNTPSTADLAFQTVSERYFNEVVPLSPVSATSLGDHRFDDQLDDMSAEARAHSVAVRRSLLDALAAIDSAQLSRAHQVDAQLLASQLEYDIWRMEELQDWRWDPLLYVGLAGDSVYTLMARDFAPLPERLRNVGKRLAMLPRLFSQMRDGLEPARVPRIHAETAAKQNGGVLSLIDELVVPQLAALPETDQAQLRATIERAREAVSQQQTWLEKRLIPQAKGDFRIGAQLYDRKLQFALDSPLTRQEIRERAERELARTRAQMYELARNVLKGRPGAPSLPDAPDEQAQQRAIVAALELAYAERPPREHVFEAARKSYEDALAFVRAHDLVTVYDDPLDIVPMPEFRQGVALAYCDPPGPLEKGQKTFFAVSPIPKSWTDAQVDSFLREYNLRSINNLTIHEAMPGHYLQLMHSNRYDSVLRAALGSGTFIEGWAVYTERLMLEQGYLNGDPLMQLIQLKWYLRTIANALLDQGVHVDGMTREQAMHLMMHDTFQEEREAAGKWTRAQLTSAQLPTYFVGFQEHMALREEAQKRWGTSFSLKRYHDAVLSYGSPPVRYVRELMFDLPIGK